MFAVGLRFVARDIGRGRYEGLSRFYRGGRLLGRTGIGKSRSKPGFREVCGKFHDLALRSFQTSAKFDGCYPLLLETRRKLSCLLLSGREFNRAPVGGGEILLEVCDLTAQRRDLCLVLNGPLCLSGLPLVPIKGRLFELLLLCFKDRQSLIASLLSDSQFLREFSKPPLLCSRFSSQFGLASRLCCPSG